MLQYKNRQTDVRVSFYDFTWRFIHLHRTHVDVQVMNDFIIKQTFVLGVQMILSMYTPYSTSDACDYRFIQCV